MNGNEMAGKLGAETGRLKADKGPLDDEWDKCGGCSRQTRNSNAQKKVL